MKSERGELYWLRDILNAIVEIETHPGYKDGKKAFDEDKYFRGWCYLQLTRIGEACVHLADDFNYKNKYADILPWRDIRGERALLVHCYWSIDDEVIWDTVEQDLPIVKRHVTNWISGLEAN